MEFETWPTPVLIYKDTVAKSYNENLSPAQKSRSSQIFPDRGLLPELKSFNSPLVYDFANQVVKNQFSAQKAGGMLKPETAGGSEIAVLNGFASHQQPLRPAGRSNTGLELKEEFFFQ